ncbi:Serine/threonine-protein kinase [Dimargaris verticillata]|uniref:non-specific serine/threonine protein kinase n=1 Tax=Dimargaris verticillata TaxID=2761393 RepID=A0A9W8B3Q3_9FUNG|nr:Serine/threonine-protein kinase [Dimargaris verticillata]
MGQPHSTVFATTSSGFTGIGTDGILTELDETVHYEKSLGNGQFMKTIRCRHPQEGAIVVKLFIKPDASLDMHRQVRQALSYHRTLKQLPNVLSYPITVETDNAVYLARQYIYASLYDRISTRPFLQPIEKKWIAFQLLCGLRDIHQLGICHGDIKCENVLVSSWNWAYLCDFAPHKPVFLPEDNPANFSYFFDASARRLCYIAPERFVAPGSHQSDMGAFAPDAEAILSQSTLKQRGRLTPAMDVFSLGCVIAELFLEGKPLFTLSQLLQYRSGEYSPQMDLTTIGDEATRALVQHMIQPNPADRFTAAEYLAQGRDQAFPSVFYSFLHPYMAGFATFLAALNAPPSATPANAATDHPVPEPAADPSVDLAALYFSVFGNSQANSADPAGPSGNTPTTLPTLIHCCSDARIDRIYHDWPMIRTAMRLPTLDSSPTSPVVSPPHDLLAQPDAEASLILVSLITSCVRNAAFPTSRRHALELLYWLSAGVADEHILDRMVPYALSMTMDAMAIVRQMAVYTLTQLLARLDTVDAINADLFVDYVLPGIRALSQDPDPLVRIALASSVAVLAETAARFLEISSSHLPLKSASDYASNALMKVDVASPPEQQVERLRDQFQTIITQLLTDPSAAVKRALLVDMTRLALFFGHKRAHDFLLSHVITYLNDRDWQLRGAFFEAVVGLATVVGPYGLAMYIMPLMTQSLTDTNEFVVEKVLHGFTALTETGLFAKPVLWDLLNFTLPLVLHPNTWIRAETMALAVAITHQLPLVDRWCVVLPALKPYLKVETLEVTIPALTEALKPPITRRLLHEVLTKTRATSSVTNAHSSAEVAGGINSTVSESPPLGPRLYRRNSSTDSLGKSPPTPALSQLAAEQTGMLTDGPTSGPPSTRWDYLRHADPSDYAKLDALAFYLDKLKTSIDRQQQSNAARHKPSTADRAALGLVRSVDEPRQLPLGTAELAEQSDMGAIPLGEFNSLGATPHTVFLTPSDAERPDFPTHPALTLDSERANRYFQPYYTTLTSPTLGRSRRGLHRVASDTHLKPNFQELPHSMPVQPNHLTASTTARVSNLGGQPNDPSLNMLLAVPNADYAKRRSFSVSGATPANLPQRSAAGLHPTLVSGQTLFVSPPLSPSSSVLSLTSIAALSQRKVGTSTVPKAHPSITVTESQVVASSNDPSRASPADVPGNAAADSPTAALDQPQTLHRLTQALKRSAAASTANGASSPSRKIKSAEWWQPFLPRQPLAHRHLLLQHSRFADAPSTKSRHVLSGAAGKDYFDTHFPTSTRSSRPTTANDLKRTSQPFSTLTLSTPTSALHWLIHYDSSQTVKTLLRKKALEVFPRHLPELGPATDASLLSRYRRITQEAIPSLPNWRPEGTLVAYFKEHTGAINALSLSSHQGFFVTASDDHTVKVWDCVRLGQHVLHHARATYHLNARVQSVTFLHHTYSLAATGDDGSVHILRFDPRQDPDTTASSSGCRLIRKASLPLAHEYAVHVVHSHTEHRSQLIVATTESRIYGLDIRTLDILWTLVNPARYGLISAFVSDPRHTWLLVGTVRGVLTLWDLRFQVLVKTWQHPSQARIYDLRLCVNPASRGRWVWMATGHNEVSVWDVEQARCVQVFCGTRSWDDLKHEIMRHQYQAQTPPTVNEALHGLGSASDELPATMDFNRAPDGMRERTISGTACSSRTRTTSNASQASHQGSVAAALATTSPTGAETAPSHTGVDTAVRTLVHPAHGKFVLVAGTDRKIRYWDLECIDHSYVISGSARDATSSTRTCYHTHQLQGASTTIFTESQAPDANHKGKYPPYGARNTAANQYDQPPPANFGMPLTAAWPSRKAGRHRHHRERLALFADHEDCITVLGLTEVPYPMIISGARDGVIRVYM